MIATWSTTIPQWGNATLIEALWLLAGLSAVVVCTSHLPDLVDDYMLTLARREDRPQLRVAARGNFRREIVRLMVGLGITGLGLYSILQPPLVPGPARITLVGLLITGVLLGVSFANVLLSWWDWHDRTAIQGLLALGYNGPKEEK